jgi:hypothetical protein
MPGLPRPPINVTLVLSPDMAHGRRREPFLEWRHNREEAVTDVSGKNKRRKGGKGYAPTRPSRLRNPGEPPPLPQPRVDDPHGFGVADEDGLRMLAALETLTSLEPDYSVDLASEASVTIIESAGFDAVADALAGEAAAGRSLRSMLPGREDPPKLLLNGYETFVGAGEEATIEIVEIDHSFDGPSHAEPAPRRHPSTLAERIAAATGRGAAGGRFFKALSGGS